MGHDTVIPLFYPLYMIYKAAPQWPSGLRCHYLAYIKRLQYTLPKNDLLCHLNWGAQVLMEISSNVQSVTMAIEKIKILGDVLELPAKQHCQFSPFGPFSWWIGWIGSAVWLVAPKRPPGFWFFQWPWVPIIHFSLFLMRPVPPNLMDIINCS